jgi:Ku protein
VGFGLVNFDVKYAPLEEAGTGRASATTCCAEHQVPVTTEWRCSEHGELVDRAGKAMLYDVDGRYVEVDTSQLVAESDKRLQIVATVDVDAIPAFYFEKSYAIWPASGAANAQAFDLIAAVLRKTGKALVGTTTMSNSTRVVILTWEHATGCVLAYRCNYDERIRWGEVELIANGIATAEPANEQMLQMAEALVGQLPDTFDLATVTDEYAAKLDEAIAAAAQGLPAPERKPEPEVAPVGDLMAALSASLATTVEETQPKKKRTKAAA